MNAISPYRPKRDGNKICVRCEKVSSWAKQPVTIFGPQRRFSAGNPGPTSSVWAKRRRDRKPFARSYHPSKGRATAETGPPLPPGFCASTRYRHVPKSISHHSKGLREQHGTGGNQDQRGRIPTNAPPGNVLGSSQPRSGRIEFADRSRRAASTTFKRPLPSGLVAGFKPRQLVLTTCRS